MTTRALDLALGQPWAIEPEALETVLQIAARAGEDPEAVAAKLGRPLENTREVRARDGSAIIPIAGPIFRRANLFTAISGATSVEVLATDLQTAADDPSIDRLILEIDSPGGQATGISELAAQIHAIGQTKPVIAYVDGMAASAAYWLAAAATQIVADKTALLGSIGVIASYKPEKDGPIKVISSVSPLKQATPDTDAGRAEMQRIVDDLAAIFITDIAAYRLTTPEQVASDFGRGGVLVGQAAVAAGMADRLGGFESLFPSAGSAGSNHPRGIPMAYQSQINTEFGLSADASADQALSAIAAKFKDAKTEAHAAGSEDEHKRIFAILDSEAAQRRPGAAQALARKAGVDATLAADILTALPEEHPAMDPAQAQAAEAARAAGGRSPSAFEQHMAALGNPPIGADQDTRRDPEADATALWDRVAARYAPAKH